ncbi:MAG: CD225/dispanin family protein [Proteiniphilum sp.]
MEYRNEPEGQGSQYEKSYSPPPPPQELMVDEIPPLKPSNWLWQSIVATILCCLPFGIVGIIFAVKVDSLYFKGQYAESEKMAQKAKMWTLVAFGVGLVYIIFWVIMAYTGNLEEYMQNIIERGASGYNF